MTLEEVRARTKELENKLVAEIRQFELDAGFLLVNRITVHRVGSLPDGVQLDVTLRI